MRGLKGTCAALPHSEQMTAKYSRGRAVVAALVAARTADIARVVAARLAHRTARGSTAGAALGIRDEALLRVELLVSRRVDELHAAVDARQGSIRIGHRWTSWGRDDDRRMRPGDTRSQHETADEWRSECRAPSVPVLSCGPVWWAHRIVSRRVHRDRQNRQRQGAAGARPRASRTTGGAASGPRGVAQWARRVRSSLATRVAASHARQGRDSHDAAAAAPGRRAPGGAPRRHGRTPLCSSASGSWRPSCGPSTSASRARGRRPHLRGPLRFERPAATHRSSAPPASCDGSPRPASASSSSPAPTTPTTATPSTAPSTCRPWPALPPGQ